MTVERGQRYVAYPDERQARRVFIEVTRVAKDGSWADIRCYTWAAMWTKRQPLVDGTLRYAVLRDWNQSDLSVQMADWEYERNEVSEK